MQIDPADFDLEHDVARWISEQCEIGVAFEEPSAGLYGAWSGWDEAHYGIGWSHKRFSATLREWGFGVRRTNACRMMTGIRLKRPS